MATQPESGLAQSRTHAAPALVQRTRSRSISRSRSASEMTTCVPLHGRSSVLRTPSSPTTATAVKISLGRSASTHNEGSRCVRSDAAESCGSRTGWQRTSAGSTTVSAASAATACTGGACPLGSWLAATVCCKTVFAKRTADQITISQGLQKHTSPFELLAHPCGCSGRRPSRWCVGRPTQVTQCHARLRRLPRSWPKSTPILTYQPLFNGPASALQD